jgi:hypothetical protein
MRHVFAPHAERSPPMIPRYYAACFTFSLITSVAPALAGPDWVEGGIDAGSTVGGAQKTTGTGPIHRISGSLSGSRAVDFEDMYLITITDPVNFSMTLTPSPGLDAQLFLFNVTQANEAFGLLANDNTSPSNLTPTLLPNATDGTFAGVHNPGVYAVAVAGAGRYPVSVSGAIFFYASSTEISGPDGPGGINPHMGWEGPGSGGTYGIDVIGVGFYQTPAPGSAALLALGAGVFARRRRR